MKVFYSTSKCASPVRAWAEIKNSLPNFEQVNDPSQADVILAYLCAMSADEIAESRTQLSRFSEVKAAHPQIKLLAGGCIAEMTDLKNEFPEIDATFTKLSMTENALKELGITEKSTKPAVETYADGTAAISIATGCLRHCAFCKTAYLDMTLHSIPEEQIFAEIEEAVKHQGTRHINITGENTTEWGIDLFGEPRLLYLLRKILSNFPEIKILDVCGVALDEVTPKLLKFLVRTPEIGLIQIEAQSFIPAVRKAMNLSKTAAEAKQIIEELAGKKAIISNIMIGHPGETAADFRAQKEYLCRKRLYMLDPDAFVSTPGTKSSELQQIPAAEKEKRVMELSATFVKLRAQRADELVKLGFSGGTLPARVLQHTSKGPLLMLCNEPIVVYAEESAPIGARVNCRIKSLFSVASPTNNMIHMTGNIVT